MKNSLLFGWAILMIVFGAKLLFDVNFDRIANLADDALSLFLGGMNLSGGGFLAIETAKKFFKE